MPSVNLQNKCDLNLNTSDDTFMLPTREMVLVKIQKKYHTHREARIQTKEINRKRRYTCAHCIHCRDIASVHRLPTVEILYFPIAETSPCTLAVVSDFIFWSSETINI